MSENRPLTLTVEQVAEILGVARSTAYELVRNGDIESIRLRRRIVVPVARLAERLGVDSEAVWAAHASPTVDVPRRPSSSAQSRSTVHLPEPTTGAMSSLF